MKPTEFAVMRIRAEDYLSEKYKVGLLSTYVAGAALFVYWVSESAVIGVVVGGLIGLSLFVFGWLLERWLLNYNKFDFSLVELEDCVQFWLFGGVVSVKKKWVKFESGKVAHVRFPVWLRVGCRTWRGT